uniref:Uncharacterized protein n=1 Tax=Anguilla anguilla TaxID=7936 RepID=A0A0E9VG00_ANGAN
MDVIPTVYLSEDHRYSSVFPLRIQMSTPPHHPTSSRILSTPGGSLLLPLWVTMSIS